MVKILDKVLKDAIAANKYKCGTKQVLGSIKGSKLIVVSNTTPPDFRSKIESEANQENVPNYFLALDLDYQHIFVLYF